MSNNRGKIKDSLANAMLCKLLTTKRIATARDANKVINICNKGEQKILPAFKRKELEELIPVFSQTQQDKVKILKFFFKIKFVKSL